MAMSSLSVSNLIDITRSNDAPGSCHPDYIQFSPSSWAPHQVGNTAAFDLRRAFYSPKRGNRANIGAKK
jgi:hypothetical protein